VSRLQRALLPGYHFPQLQHLSTRGQVYQSYLATTTTLRGYFHLSRVLTFNDAGLRQRSLCGWRLGLCLRGGRGLLSGQCGFLFRHHCGRFIPSQDKSVDFLQSTQAGCQSSTTTTSNILLGKDQHLQARSDHRHGWGTEDIGNVDQSSLGRCLFLRLSSRYLFSGSSGRFCAPLSRRGWRSSCAKSSSTMGAGLRLPLAGSPIVSQSPSTPCSMGSEGGISCNQGNFVVNT
jgi:hypothetical protein